MMNLYNIQHFNIKIAVEGQMCMHIFLRIIIVQVFKLTTVTGCSPSSQNKQDTIYMYTKILGHNCCMRLISVILYHHWNTREAQVMTSFLPLCLLQNKCRLITRCTQSIINTCTQLLSLKKRANFDQILCTSFI